MKGIVLNMCLLFLFTAFCTAQKVTYSDVLNENSKDMYYHIIGKVNGNILILKAQSPKFAISIYQDDMVLKDKLILILFLLKLSI